MSDELRTHLNVIEGIRNKTILEDDFEWGDIRALQTLFSLLPQAVPEEFRQKYGSALIATVSVVVDAVNREMPKFDSENFVKKILEYRSFIKDEFEQTLQMQADGKEVGKWVVEEVGRLAKENAEKKEEELHGRFGGRRLKD